MKRVEENIKSLSDKELSKALNATIKVLSQMPDSIIYDWTRAENQYRIDVMLKEWNKRAKADNDKTAKKT